MPRTIATTDRVDLAGLLEFVRPRHHMILTTRRRDGSPQLSPVSAGVDPDGRAPWPAEPADPTGSRDEPAGRVLIGPVRAGPL